MHEQHARTKRMFVNNHQTSESARVHEFDLLDNHVEDDGLFFGGRKLEDERLIHSVSDVC